MGISSSLLRVHGMKEGEEDNTMVIVKAEYYLHVF